MYFAHALPKEFKDNKDVSILLKTNFGKGTTADRKICKDYLTSLKTALKLNNLPKVKLLHGNMKKEEIAALFHHHNVKMYVSATRGEGYGLPLIEAAAAGLPIVVTGWSGHLQFLNKECFGKRTARLSCLLVTNLEIFEPFFNFKINVIGPGENSLYSLIKLSLITQSFLSLSIFE